MNKVVMIGNLTRDPELSTTPNGIAVCKFAIAVNRNFANQNGEREADFFNIIAWRNLGESCGKFLTKGKKVAVSGSIQNRQYDDKDGNKKFFTEIVADDVEFLSPRDGGAGGMGAVPGYGTPPPAGVAGGGTKTTELKPIESDDLPF
ncbi:MAG: single-stranded DNA-binding protein [Firmicutes bacterium]|nr:single-stranded DNA-binding protein [Bacillota bacterium]